MKLTVVHLEGSKQGLTETFSGQVITVGRDPSNTLSFDPFKRVTLVTLDSVKRVILFSSPSTPPNV